MSETTYRAAIIGLGFVGAGDQVSGDALGQQVRNLDGTHLAALSGNRRVEVVAGSSRDEGRRRRFASRTGAATYASWGEMLKQEAPDIVSVATYTPAHAEITIACAEAGVRAVYCEKPIASRLPDAERMVAACKQGRLGNVGTHMFDATCMLTGRRIAAVSGTLDPAGRPDCRGEQFRDPGGWGVMRLERDLMATLDAADYATAPACIIIHGTEGRAVTGRHDVTIERPDGGREHWPAPDDGRSSMDRAVEQIVAWLDGRAAFPYDAEDAVHVLEAIIALHASHARKAAWTELPLSGAEREIEVRCG